ARDGGSALRVYMSNVMNTPTEVVEAEYPLRVEEHALRPGSGGDGRQRGGLGFRRAYRVVAPEVTLTSMLDRRVVPPWGVGGGGDGLPFRITLNPGTPGARDIGGKVSMRLARGDLVLVETCDGGGHGERCATRRTAARLDRPGPRPAGARRRVGARAGHCARPGQSRRLSSCASRPPSARHRGGAIESELRSPTKRQSLRACRR